MQGKGGVGKSLLAFFLAQYVREKTGKCLVFDTDPLNPTLSRTKALDVKILRLLAEDHTTILKNAFDLMIEDCSSMDSDAIIDIGASSFIPMLEYCDRNGVHDLWGEMGHSCILHSIITGKDFAETCDLFGVVMEKTGRLPSVSSVVWLNPYAGPVEMNGLGFEKTSVYNENERHIRAVLPMPAFTDDMFKPDFLAMMGAGKTFDEMIADPGVALMSRQRIRMMKREVFDVMERAGIFASKGGV
jgi:hypothetical protein